MLADKNRLAFFWKSMKMNKTFLHYQFKCKGRKFLRKAPAVTHISTLNPIPDGVGGIHQDFTETLITRKVCAFKTWERCLNFPWFIA